MGMEGRMEGTRMEEEDTQTIEEMIEEVMTEEVEMIEEEDMIGETEALPEKTIEEADQMSLCL